MNNGKIQTSKQPSQISFHGKRLSSQKMKNKCSNLVKQYKRKYLKTIAVKSQQQV